MSPWRRGRGALLAAVVVLWPRTCDLFAFCGGVKRVQRLGQHLAATSQWLPVASTPALEPADDATVLPVFPLSSVYWPGSEATLQIIDPAYRKMYDDILMSGSRRFVVTFTRSLPGGRVRYAEMPEEDRRLFEIGTVLYLTDLEEVSSQTGGQVKYVAKHEVQDRAQLVRLLNPSALFETDSKGNKINYLKAEVRLLPSEEENTGEETWRGDLLDTWRQLQVLSHQFQEPHLAGSFFSSVAPNVSSWVLAAAWQQLRVATQVKRLQKQAMEDVKQYIESGDFKSLTQEEALKKLPPGLLRRLSGQVDLDQDFWLALLEILSADSAQQRGEKLAELVEAELKLSRTRFALKQALN
ncbi:unnamed protein product [Effrenium voratum]|uniref:Lon N-terminal domain-containing protein n=1 Tax=Effrenium voratum TaxID=2562239 RepID=A0AA36NKK9_9DINO|nr:unnamed protein product [Effrenium voratum]CAJ1410929.1 unnamed protein product [Effrenium voratum]CAJ1446327.1 unnamed protein product [Effrenium voratum]